MVTETKESIHIISERSKLKQKNIRLDDVWVRKVDPPGIVASGFNLSTRTYGYSQPIISPGDWDTQILWDFEIQTNHLISARRPDQVIVNKKKGTCRIVDFTVFAELRLRLKEVKKKDKYLYKYFNIDTQIKEGLNEQVSKG